MYIFIEVLFIRRGTVKGTYMVGHSHLKKKKRVKIQHKQVFILIIINE